MRNDFSLLTEMKSEFTNNKEFSALSHSLRNKSLVWRANFIIGLDQILTIFKLQ